MAVEVRQFAVTVPAGTTIASNWTQTITFPPRVVDQINVKVPPGPRGQLGFAIGTSGMPLIPAGPGVYVVADDQEIEWPLSDILESGSWQVFAYNTGNYQHTIYLTFLCDLIPAQPATPAPIAADALSMPVSLAGST